MDRIDKEQINIDRLQRCKQIIKDYKNVEFHLKDGTIYHIKNFAEFKYLIMRS